jgi:hypothetical protein
MTKMNKAIDWHGIISLNSNLKLNYLYEYIIML